MNRVLLTCVVAAMLALSSSTADAKRRRGKRKAPPTTTQPEAPPKRTTQRVAVLEFSALGAVVDASDGGISSNLVRSLELIVRNSVGRMHGYDVLPATDVRVALTAPKNRAVAECGGGPKCAAAAGALVDADVVVYGSISAFGQTFVVDMRSVDVSTGRETGKQQSTLTGDRNQLIPEVQLAVFQLIAPAQIRGSLVVDIDVDGVQVEIDGKAVGVTPFAKPIDDLTPGDHVVVLRRPGYSEFQREFTIKPFETAYLELHLQKGTASPQ